MDVVGWRLRRGDSPLRPRHWAKTFGGAPRKGRSNIASALRDLDNFFIDEVHYAVTD